MGGVGGGGGGDLGTTFSLRWPLTLKFDKAAQQFFKINICYRSFDMGKKLSSRHIDHL